MVDMGHDRDVAEVIANGRVGAGVEHRAGQVGSNRIAHGPADCPTDAAASIEP